MSEYKDIVKKNSDLLLILSSTILYAISTYLKIFYLQIILAPCTIFCFGYLFVILIYLKRKIVDLQKYILSIFVAIAILPIIGYLSILIFGYIDIKTLLVLLLAFVFIFEVIIVYLRSRYSINSYISLKTNELNIYNINIILVCIIIFFVGILIRVYPYINFSTFPGTWFSPNSFYPTLYTIQTKKLLDIGDINTPTAFASSVYNYISLKGYILFQVIFFLMFNLTKLNEMLIVNKYLPWVGALLFPLAALLVANKIEEKEKFKLSTKEYLLIFLLGGFMSFYTTYLTKRMCVALPYGWLFLLLSIYTLLDDSVESKILGVLFGFSIVWFYYTAASTYFIILLTILIIQTAHRKKVVSIDYIAYYSLVYLGYLVYLAERFFHSYISVIKIIISQEHMTIVTTINKYTAPISITSLWYFIVYINGFSIGLVYLLFIYWKFKNKFRNSCSDILLHIIVGLFTVSIVFFRWRGIKGFMGRMEQYTSVILLLIFPILLSNILNRYKKFLYLIAILIISTSIFGHILNNVMQPAYITYPEKSAIEWYAKFGDDKRVFTDFRIGTAPFLVNCWNFTGIMTVPHTLKIEEVQKLINIYYTDNATIAYKTISKYYRVSYILLSKEMCTRGVVTSSENFKPISPKLFFVYDRSKLFDKIYSNGYACYYMLK